MLEDKKGALTVFCRRTVLRTMRRLFEYKFVVGLMIIYSDVGCILMNNTGVRIFLAKNCR